MTLTLALFTAGFLYSAEPTSADIVQSKFQDATFVVRVVEADQSELRKIKKDFGETYRFKSVTANLKEPLKMRLEAKVEGTTVVYVINDFIRYWNVSGVGLKGNEDLHNKPGKLQTALDYGIVTPAVLDELFLAKYVRTERGTGEYVFDLTYKPKFSDTSRHRIWMDPKKRVMTKRQWFDQGGDQVGTFYYEKPQEQSGVWFPSRGVVKNKEGKVGGIVEYEKVKVNSGLAESLFRI